MKFGSRISLQRLQGLHRSWLGVADSRVLAAIAGVLLQQVTANGASSRIPFFKSHGLHKHRFHTWGQAAPGSRRPLPHGS